MAIGTAKSRVGPGYAMQFILGQTDQVLHEVRRT
jgi:hypothetical protein